MYYPDHNQLTIILYIWIAHVTSSSQRNSNKKSSKDFSTRPSLWWYSSFYRAAELGSLRVCHHPWSHCESLKRQLVSVSSQVIQVWHDFKIFSWSSSSSSSCYECTHKLFNVILPPSPLQIQGLVDHMPHMSVFPALTKEPLHMQIHTRVSVVWICAWWHHSELLHHTAHFILTSRYTGFKAFHTK
jgi:hypothetical protein